MLSLMGADEQTRAHKALLLTWVEEAALIYSHHGNVS
jgi:hypothetical protein